MRYAHNYSNTAYDTELYVCVVLEFSMVHKLNISDNEGESSSQIGLSSTGKGRGEPLLSKFCEYTLLLYYEVYLSFKIVSSI